MWEIFMWILAIYGVLKIMQDIVELIEIRKILKGEIEVRLRVCNKEDEIEYIVDNLIKNMPDASIKVEDAGSCDNTYGILKKIEVLNKNIYVTKM